MKLFFPIIAIAFLSISFIDASAQRSRSSRDGKFRIWHNSRKGQVKKAEVHKKKHPKLFKLKHNNGRRSDRAYVKRNNGKKHFFWPKHDNGRRKKKW